MNADIFITSVYKTENRMKVKNSQCLFVYLSARVFDSIKFETTHWQQHLYENSNTAHSSNKCILLVMKVNSLHNAHVNF